MSLPIATGIELVAEMLVRHQKQGCVGAWRINGKRTCICQELIDGVAEIREAMERIKAAVPAASH
jgi:hypothetical protein